MSVLLVVNTAPYGSEGPLQRVQARRGAHPARRARRDLPHGRRRPRGRAGQDPRGAHASLERLLVQVLLNGAECSCCGTCCAARGLAGVDLVADVSVATIHDLAAALVRSDKVVSF